MTGPKVPAADHTLRILRLLARSRGPLPASIIAARLELPRSTVYQLLATLQEHGFVMHLAEERRYGLGLSAVELSSAYERQEPLVHLGRPLLAGLVDRLQLSGHLAVPSGSDVLYVIEERAAGAPRLITDVDVRLPMHLTASGRAILAALPKAQVRALYPNAQAFAHSSARSTAQSVEPSPAESSPSSSSPSSSAPSSSAPSSSAPSSVSSFVPSGPIDRYSRLRTILEEAVARGFAVERGSVTEGLSSVAVPVLDHRGWPVAAIAVTFPDDAVATADYASVAGDVRVTAGLLAARIHGRA